MVEVRQGTLGVDGRGGGPAGNAGMVTVEARQGTLGVDGPRNPGRGWSWLRSGKEHWAWMIAVVMVEVRQGTLVKPATPSDQYIPIGILFSACLHKDQTRHPL